VGLADDARGILPGRSVVATPGHAAGHQSVVVSTGNGVEVLIGDAAYKPRKYLEPDDGDLPPGQAIRIDGPVGRAAQSPAGRPE
jgi:glyoxylase-like metal-dependent hydrolase (beta-lactamase superfamily II)